MLKNTIGKTKHIWNVFFCLVCITMSCNDPAADKYQKMSDSHPTIISHILPKYYFNLFQQKKGGKIKLVSSVENLGRDTVSNFSYNKDYDIAMYTLSRSYDFSLRKSLHESFGESSEEVGTPFYANGIKLLGIRHRILVTDADKPSNIFISFGGSGFSIAEKNDTVADYFFDCKNLSIKYKANGHQEVFVKADDHRPLEIIFLKHEKKLFLIFITTKKDSASFQHSIGASLFKCFKG